MHRVKKNLAIIAMLAVMTFHNANAQRKVTTYICTLVYCHDEGDVSFYPSVTGKQDLCGTKKFQEIYWRCATVMFASSIRHNPQAKHILFSNKKEDIPQPFKNLLKEFSVEVVTLPFDRKVPEKYFTAFRSKWFLLDIIQHLSLMVNDTDKVIFLDSDCLWIKPCNSIVQDIDKYGILTRYGNFHNDLQPKIKQFYEKKLGLEIQKPLKQMHAEFIATSKVYLEKLSIEIEREWKDMIDGIDKGEEPVLTLEEFFLSFIYYKNNYFNDVATNYLKRIWTWQGRNVTGTEHDLTIWHLPGEKRNGFFKLFNEIEEKNSPFWTLPMGEEFTNYCGKKLHIY